MGNICPANKSGENGSGGYKSGSSREHVYKLGIQKGGLDNINSAGNHHYPLMGLNGNGSVNGGTNGHAANMLLNGEKMLLISNDLNSVQDLKGD